MRLIKALAVALLVASAFTQRSSAQGPATGPFVAGEILVKFRPGASEAGKSDAHRQGGGTLLSAIARTGIQSVAVPAGNERAAIARYQSNPNVLYAEPNFIRTIPRLSDHGPGSEVVPGDYYFDEQWSLHNTGQGFQCIATIIGPLCFYIGTAGADIDAPEAWAISTGPFREVKVAVIDSGIDYYHPDLEANYAGGADFIYNDGDPMDDQGHGTHVSGTIAALMDNLTGTPGQEEGVVGVAPNARILMYKACSADGSCTDLAIQQGIAQAIADGAKVINMSLGGADFSQSLSDAVQDAWNAGLVIVAAAGNAGNTALSYPAAYDNVISVGAFDEDHRRASFSTYGNWVDISAPGNVIMSTYPQSGCGGAPGTTPGDIGCYAWNSGTSMASPHVAGAAALVWSRSDVATNSQVVEILLNSAEPSGVDVVRLDSWTIHGGLNLHNAMGYGVTNLPPTANAGPDQNLTADGGGMVTVSLDGSGSSDPDGGIVSYEWSEGVTAIAVVATPSVTLSVGVHTLVLEVTDAGGATGTDSVVVTVNPANLPPVAANTSATTVVGTPVTITLSATDALTCELTFAIVQGPLSGGLGGITNQACASGTPNNSDTAQVTYTPGSTSGSVLFTYKASDGSADSNTATVTVTVNPAPVVTFTVEGITPNRVSQSAGRVIFTITGTGFASGASVTFLNGAGKAPRVISVTQNNSTQLTVVADMRTGGPRRDRRWDVVVTNPGGATATGVGLLTITP